MGKRNRIRNTNEPPTLETALRFAYYGLTISAQPRSDVQVGGVSATDPGHMHPKGWTLRRR